MIDLYQRLGVANEATFAEIRSATETARLILSDDSENQNQTELQRKVSSLNLAQRVLLDEQRRRDYDNALGYAENISASHNTGEVKDLVDKAWSLVSDDKSIAQAIALAERATQVEPDNVRALGVLAYANQRWGELDEAHRVIKRTLQLAPLDSAAHGVLASIYKEKERYADAIQAFERGFALDTAMPEAFGSDYCACLWSTRQHEKAIAFLEAERQRSPGKQDVATALALSYCLRIPQNWTQVDEKNEQGAPAGSYITTRAQAETSIALLEKARQLDVSDESARTQVKELAENLRSAVERRLHGSAVGAIAGGLLWAFFYGSGLILAPAYFFAARAPGYLINRDHLAGKATADREASAQQGMDKVVAYAVNGVVLPILVVRSYLKNFTGEQKDLQPLIQRARALCVKKP